ncbi:hypothetical protein FGG08_004537 [Glutinoglossum americanum]|uniref:Uncharacterized protein n=1 Tax=Glutinoglossum americanum TaxID=1670608 RepID=A0A9P8I046_9PEZI|nr:hypothetical protein FGG08_004537 [Glutinoglossum americanum]
MKNRRRSASCHNVGQYLLVVGGNNPRQEDIIESANCDSALVKIYNLNTQSVRSSPYPTFFCQQLEVLISRCDVKQWTDQFESPPTPYIPFKNITTWYAEHGYKPIDGFGDTRIEEILRALVPDPKKVKGRKAGIAIGTIVAAALAGWAGIWLWRRREPVKEMIENGVKRIREWVMNLWQNRPRSRPTNATTGTASAPTGNANVMTGVTIDASNATANPVELSSRGEGGGSQDPQPEELESPQPYGARQGSQGSHELWTSMPVDGETAMHQGEESRNLLS